jgi:glutamine amidotransferase
MTRLFGCVCNQHERFRAAIEPVRSVLVAPGPLARWGLGYVHSSQVLLSLNPRVSETGVDFFEAAAKLKTDYLIAAAHEADGLKGNANTQPFRFRSWLFAMEGGIAAFDDVAPGLLEHIPPYLRRNMRGKTAAEHVFHLYLAMLHDAGNMDHPNLDPADGQRALRDTLAFTLSQITRSGGSTGPGNIIVTNSRFMLAARLEKPLFVRQFREQLDPKREESQLKSVLAVSSDEHPGEGFEEVPLGQVLTIHRSVLAEISPLS